VSEAPSSPRGIEVTLRAVAEETPGARWQALFASLWPSYEAWFLREGERARPPYAECRRRLKAHMPELVPAWERLVDLAGGGDRAARFLSLWRPTPYLAGCSQAVWTRGDPLLVRNYDYAPALWEAVLLHTRWEGLRVLAMTDCLWGVLDGLNEAGLAASLSFGGRRAVGEGFGCPLLLRYALERCATAREAGRALARLPSHMAYNVTLADREGDFVTVHLAPDRPAEIHRRPWATNHQEVRRWEAYLEATGTREREALLAARLADPTESAERLADRFLEPPLHARAWARGRGTLYTALYRPRAGSAEYRWPGLRLRQDLAGFREGAGPLSFPPT
jgi:predicted choloylglycine hydrolase